MSLRGWLWFQEQLVRQGVEPEEVEEMEEVEEAFRRGDLPTGASRFPGVPGHPALRRLGARIGNRALAQLLRKARGAAAEPDRLERSAAPAEAAGPPPRKAPDDEPPPPGKGDGGAGKAPKAVPAPEARPIPGADVDRKPQASPKPPDRLVMERLRSVLDSLPGGFDPDAWGGLLEVWREAPAPTRDIAVRALTRAILRLPVEARTALAQALERLGSIPGVDLLARLRSALAVTPSRAEVAPPPPPDDGG